MYIGSTWSLVTASTSHWRQCSSPGRGPHASSMMDNPHPKSTRVPCIPRPPGGAGGRVCAIPTSSVARRAEGSAPRRRGPSVDHLGADPTRSPSSFAMASLCLWQRDRAPQLHGKGGVDGGRTAGASPERLPLLAGGPHGMGGGASRATRSACCRRGCWVPPICFYTGPSSGLVCLTGFGCPARIPACA